jgi:hypothetical protein
MLYKVIRILMILTISMACLGDLLSEDINDDFLCLPPDFFVGIFLIVLLVICFKFYQTNIIYTRVNELTAYLAMREKSPPAILV